MEPGVLRVGKGRDERHIKNSPSRSKLSGRCIHSMMVRGQTNPLHDNETKIFIAKGPTVNCALMV
jgi:hypothetical protein